MKAAILEKFAEGEKWHVRDVDIDQPRGREVLIQTKATGLCHSDRHIQHVTDPVAAKESMGVEAPLIAGHESAGVVIAVGPDVQELEVGDHVVSNLISYCGSCDECRAGMFNACSNPEFVRRGPDEPPRLSLDGEPIFQMADLSGFAEQMLVHEHNAVKIPKEVPFEAACLIGCGVITGAGAAVNAAEVRVGDTVAVIGTGGVGLNVIQGARLAGATTIIAIDLDPVKLEMATKFGATHTINSGEVSDLAAEQAWTLLRTRGTFMQVGMHKPGVSLELPTLPDMLQSQKGLRGVYMGQSNPKRDIYMYADLYLQGRYNLDDLVSRKISLDQIDEAYESLEGGGIARNVIVFDD